MITSKKFFFSYYFKLLKKKVAENYLLDLVFTLIKLAPQSLEYIKTKCIKENFLANF